ncbi:MAG: hypothetical protein K0R93_1707 [Anaerosolibacter sp.]|uniref:hypothetical protein n=1 Tax=Anaerosolibacter sp. TaxID=1872527 RepID=UPI00261ED050|nr:hypothetical protein [Anaerosolibacter sp.]MDF2546809.1 hypothetical protein [Anaerosolibacter sp.]
MHNAAVSLMNLTKDHSPSSTNTDNQPMNRSEVPEKKVNTMNFWGQGAHADDLDFFQSDVYAFLKIVK